MDSDVIPASLGDSERLGSEPDSESPEPTEPDSESRRTLPSGSVVEPDSERPGSELRAQAWTHKASGVGRADSIRARIGSARADANLRYQDALDWRKWTKGGWDFPFCPRSFEKAVMVVKW